MKTKKHISLDDVYDFFYNPTEECPNCEGKGKFTGTESCPGCHGAKQHPISVLGGRMVDCQRCYGSGTIGTSSDCSLCHGQGEVHHLESMQDYLHFLYNFLGQKASQIKRDGDGHWQLIESQEIDKKIEASKNIDRAFGMSLMADRRFESIVNSIESAEEVLYKLLDARKEIERCQ